ncbi:sugar ABC transporter substrate-binding protein [Mesotoga sp. TolDC]|uniref:sugar ABC transporter substrate-binding protein n=1 Tax=Mesotoga sp. TolDC TaxID=1389250 RepID=UPI0021AC81D0|nr:sugar ABC transporter substrate-binding protein [Mesotoga sp. TolDC]
MVQVKKLSVLLIVVFAMFGVTALSTDTMVCTYAQMANDFFLTFDKGARESVEALGNMYIAASDDRSPEKFLFQIESFAAAGVKMIFGYSPTIESVIQASNFVNREKVYYANILEIADWWTPLDAGPYYGQFIGPDAYVDGYLGGLEMGRLLNGEGETCVLWGFPGSKAGNDRVRGYKAALMENFPNITVIGEEYADFIRDKGYSVTRDWIAKFGDRIDGIFGANTSMNVGAAIACEEAGLKHVYQVTTDANKSNLVDIKDGSLDVVAGIYGFWMAGRQAVTVYDMKNGWKPTVPETMMSTMQTFITPENVDWYIETFGKDTPYDYDWKKMSRTLHPDDWDPQGFLVPIYPERFTNWIYLEKPRGYEVPEEYKEAMESGLYQEIYELYLEKFTAAWVVPPFESSPYNYVFVANNLEEGLRADIVKRMENDVLVHEVIDVPYRFDIPDFGEGCNN